MAGKLVIDTLQDSSGNSASATDAIKGSAKAWVNFNGVTTAVIRASYNVSSVTRNAVGDYTVNFTNALTDANYSASVASGLLGSTYGFPAFNGLTGTGTSPFSATQCRFITGNSTGVTSDNAYVCVSIFR